jgi:non-canonical (house-cleaning) NTP pyrophosphatase
MDQQEVISRYEARANALKLSIAELCKEAGIHPTTFSRWKVSEKNPRPVGMTFTSMSAIERALAAREQVPGRRARAA